jgi:hypothetical protein
MILIPLIDIDNFKLSRIEPLWSLMIKGERLYKDSKNMTKRETLTLT